MPGINALMDVVGLQPVELFVPDTVQRFPLGYKLLMNDPIYGYGEFIYCQVGATQASAGRVVTWTDAFLTADAPVTTLTGYPIGVLKTAALINTFAWVQVEGITPAQCNASVTAGVAFSVAAAGQFGATAASKQVLNARVMQASTFAPTKTVQTRTGLFDLIVPNIDRLFVGLPVSGTGIAGGSTIAALDPSGNVVRLNNAMTAFGTVTATFTHTGFLIVLLNKAFLQGAIT